MNAFTFSFKIPTCSSMVNLNDQFPIKKINPLFRDYKFVF